MMVRATFIVTFSIFMVFAPIPTQAGDGFRFSSFFKQKRPTETAVVQLAKTLDELEKKLNRDGTVVAKAPDIWGEARLTKHRQEFEREMSGEVGKFQFRLNAAIARSDQAFLANALAIGVADGTVGQAPPPSIDISQLNQLSNGLPTQETPEGDIKSSTQSVIYTAPTHGLIRNDSPLASKAIDIEPSIYLDQKARYLNHLNELRRMNEGDDTADAPGYALNLVRIPISLMPGTVTRKGHGAEVTVTATPHITEELLPTTFRQLVINDLVDQLAPVIRRYAERIRHIKQAIASLGEESTSTRSQTEQKKAERKGLSKEVLSKEVLSTLTAEMSPSKKAQKLLQAAARIFPKQMGTIIAQMGIANLILPEELCLPEFLLVMTRFYGYDGLAARMAGADNSHFPSRFDPELRALADKYNYDSSAFKRDTFSVTKLMSQVASSNFVLNAGSVTRRSREALSSSQIPIAFGAYELISIALDLESRTDDNEIIHLSAVRAYLKEELESAYDITTRPDSPAFQLLTNHDSVLDSSFGSPSILGQLRNLTYESAFELFKTRLTVTNQFSRVISLPSVSILTEQVLSQFDSSSKSTNSSGLVVKCAIEKLRLDEHSELHLPSVTSSLAWAVVVESVLLNDKLNQDIRRISQDPECQCTSYGEMIFCGADPSPQARQAFVEYVRCRWPVHVFALDPQTQDQNVADSFSMRREMQLALALAFAGGNISAQNMTRYVRRLEQDMETIALNRTVASFGHGRDVFGWRFYPRVQSPPFEGNGKTIFRDLLGGGPSKDNLRRSWEVEPGMRECTAVVLMPSFITHMTFDIRGNYFPLGRHKFRDPSDTRTSIEDNMEMSHKIRLIENATCSIAAEASYYRDGETQRLLRRADQVAKKLPLQTVHARVPNENYLGGFEMFSAGTSDLAPELLDFYGMPGVDTGKATTFFLVGNNFSVHDTKVLAGNSSINYDLMSRQVMRITIPAGAQTVDKTVCGKELACWESKRVVNVHIATPYGVSQALEIPVLETNKQDVSNGYRWERENIPVRYRIKTVESETKKTRKLTTTNAKIYLAPPYLLDINAPGGNLPRPPSADVNFVVTIPQLGYSYHIAPATEADPFTAAYDARLNKYRIQAPTFYKLQTSLQASLVKIFNDSQEASFGTTHFEMRLEASMKFKDNNLTIPLDNILTQNVELIIEE